MGPATAVEAEGESKEKKRRPIRRSSKKGFPSWQVERLRRTGWSPSGIVAMKSSKSRIAVAREDGTIEVCDGQLGLRPVRRFSGQKASAAVALCWLRDHVIVSTANGILFLAHFDDNTAQSQTDCLGGCAWALAKDPRGPNSITAACEDGTLRTFHFVEEEYSLEYTSALRIRTDGRCVSLLHLERTERSASLITVVGCDDGTIRLLRENGQPERLTVGDSSLITWCLAEIDGSTFCSGDSRGNVTIWDARIGVALHSLRRHEADVLCLAVYRNTIYAAGIDAKIAVFIKLEERENWVYSRAHRCHGLDVRSLCLIDHLDLAGSSTTDSQVPALISGGLDTKICALELKDNESRPRRFWPFPYHSCVVKCDQYLGVASGQRLEITDLSTLPPRIILRLRADADRNIVCFDMRSTQTNLLEVALCDGNQTRLVRFDLESCALVAIAQRLPAAHALKFFRDGRLVLSVAAPEPRIDIFEWETSIFSVAIDQSRACLLAVSNSDGLIAVSSVMGHPVLIDPSRPSHEALYPLKRLPSVVGLAFDADRRLIVASRQKGRTTLACASSLMWNQNDTTPPSETRLNQALAVANNRLATIPRFEFLAFDTGRPGRILAYGHASLVVIDTNTKGSPRVFASDRYQPLLFASQPPALSKKTSSASGDDEDSAPDIFVVEHPWIHVAQAQNIRPLKRKRFGLS